MSKRLFQSRAITVDVALALQHELTWDAAGIAEFIFLNSKTKDKGPTASEVAAFFNMSKGRVDAALKKLHTLGFIERAKDRGATVTDSYVDTFVLQVEDPKTKLHETAKVYLEYLADATGKRFSERSMPNAEKAISKLWDKDPSVIAKDLCRVVLYCKEVEYKDDKMQKYLRTSTLLNGEFFNRLDNANAWINQVKEEGFFANQN